jgi:DNA polymerase-1
MAFPKRGGARRAVKAPRGKKLVIADYDAIEMRVLADQIHNEALVDLFLSRRDPHRFTASRLFGIAECDVSDLQRKGAKAINYGFLFRMGINGFIEYARKTFGLRFDRKDAVRFRESFFAAYPRIPEWQSFVQKGGYRLSLTRLGRIRYFRDSDSICVKLNSPIQGTAADGLKLAIVLLAPRLVPLGARIILCIHDELIVEAPEETALEVEHVVVESMREGMARFVRSVPIEVKAFIADTWG